MIQQFTSWNDSLGHFGANKLLALKIKNKMVIQIITECWIPTKCRTFKLFPIGRSGEKANFPGI